MNFLTYMLVSLPSFKSKLSDDTFKTQEGFFLKIDNVTCKQARVPIFTPAKHHLSFILLIVNLNTV